jgi:histidine kinase family protein
MLLAANEAVRPRRRRLRLARRPLGLLTAASVLFIGMVMGVLAWADRSAALAGADRTSQVLALAFERHVGRSLAEMEGALLQIGESMEAARAAPEPVDIRLRAVQSRLMHNGELALIDPAGRLVSSSKVPVRRGLDLSGREVIRNALSEPRDGLFVGQGVLLDRDAAVGVARRITDASGTLIGIAYGSFDAEMLDGFAKEASLPQGISMMLLEEDGTVLMRRPGGEGWIGRSLASDPLFVQFSPRLRPGTYHEIAVDDRIERVATYRTVQGYPMVISIGLPADAILVPWRERSSKLLLIWALTGLALALIAALVASQARKAAERSRHRS